MTELIGVDQSARQFRNIKTFIKDKYIVSAMVNVNLVAADMIVTSLTDSYVSENGVTSHNIYVCQMGTQFRPATVLSAWLLSSVRPYNSVSTRPLNYVPIWDPLKLPPTPGFKTFFSNGMVFISEIVWRLVDSSSDIWARRSDVLFIIDPFLVLPPPPCLIFARIASWCVTTSLMIHFLYGYNPVYIVPSIILALAAGQYTPNLLPPFP